MAHLGQLEMYCVKCRKKQMCWSPQTITMKNGKPAWKGECPVCQISMFKIGGYSPVEPSYIYPAENQEIYFELGGNEGAAFTDLRISKEKGANGIQIHSFGLQQPTLSFIVKVIGFKDEKVPKRSWGITDLATVEEDTKELLARWLRSK